MRGLLLLALLGFARALDLVEHDMRFSILFELPGNREECER